MIKLGHFEDKLWTYLNSQYCANDVFPYPLQSGNRGSLLGSLFAVFIAHMLDRVDELPGCSRLADTVLDIYDEETGLFADPDITLSHYLNPEKHSSEYVSLQTTSFCYSCLDALNIKFERRMPWIEPFLVPGHVDKWLSSLDWTQPWLVSNLDMFLGNFLFREMKNYPDNSRVEAAIDEYFAWHDKMQNSETGFWGATDDLFDAMAGGYHIFVHYNYANRKIQYVEKIIDSTLSLVARDGLFVYGGGGGSCEDMDAIDILIRCSLASNYRHDDVQKVLLNAAKMIIASQNKDGGFSWRMQPKCVDLLNLKMGKNFILGKGYDLLSKIKNRSHYSCLNYYSSLSSYSYKLNKSDMWSTWFRALSVIFVSHRFEKSQSSSEDWVCPDWPGLGYDPFRGRKN